MGGGIHIMELFPTPLNPEEVLNSKDPTGMFCKHLETCCGGDPDQG